MRFAGPGGSDRGPVAGNDRVLSRGRSGALEIGVVFYRTVTGRV